MTPTDIKHGVIEVYYSVPFCSKMIGIRADHWNSLINAAQPVFVDYLDAWTINVAMDITVTNMSHYPLRDHDVELAILPHNGQSALVLVRTTFKDPSKIERIKEHGKRQ